MLFTLVGQVVTGDDYRKPDTQGKGNTGENDDVHTRTYRPLCSTGEIAFDLAEDSAATPQGRGEHSSGESVAGRGGVLIHQTLASSPKPRRGFGVA